VIPPTLSHSELARFSVYLVEINTRIKNEDEIGKRDQGEHLDKKG
jgi:hypothetical protein